MANVYVYSGAAGAGTGADWANAYTTLAAALAAKAAGDDFWVAHDHAESTAGAVTLTSPGTAASPCRIICVNRSGSVPPVSADLRTTATITTTGNNAINFGAGFAYCYGLQFTPGNSTGTSNFATSGNSPSGYYFQSCKMSLGSTGANGRIQLGSVNTGDFVVICRDCTFKFAAVGQGMMLRGVGSIIGGSVDGTGSIPTSLVLANSGSTARWTLMGVDLSALGSGKNIFLVSASTSDEYLAIDCKLGSSVGITTGSVASTGGVRVRLINCDSADTNYRYYKQVYQGTITHDTGNYRTGGASDGTTSFSRKMVSTANSKFYSPLESDWISFWNETTGSAFDVTVPFISFGTAALKDNEAFGECEYLGTSAFPLGTFATDAAADVLNAGTNQSTDSSTWTGTARANSTAYSLNDIISVQGKLFICTTAGTSAGSEPGGYATAADGDSVNDGTAVLRAGWRQKAVVNITPQEKGLIRARVCLAKPSTTLYIDPKVAS